MKVGETFVVNLNTERHSFVADVKGRLETIEGLSLVDAWNVVRAMDWVVTTPIEEDPVLLIEDCDQILQGFFTAQDPPPVVTRRMMARMTGVRAIVSAAHDTLASDAAFTPENVRALDEMVLAWHRANGTAEE